MEFSRMKDIFAVIRRNSSPTQEVLVSLNRTPQSSLYSQDLSLGSARNWDSGHRDCLRGAGLAGILQRDQKHSVSRLDAVPSLAHSLTTD